MKNLIQLKHEEFQARYGESNSNYLMMTRVINKHLREDTSFDYELTICERTLRRYAHGDCLPKQPHVIRAIAKLCGVTSWMLISDLEKYKKWMEENSHDDIKAQRA